MKIHETAIISPDASIADDTEIGAFTIIESGVSIGSGCKIHSRVHLLGETSIGDNCIIWPGTIIGGDPQAIVFDPAIQSGIEIGSDTIIRENVTIHRSLYEGEKTIIGKANFLMAGTHIGHDCVLGNHNVLANTATMGGHVIMGDHCFVGGNAVIHQFVRIGDFALFQGLAGASLDIPPYVTVYGINQIAGLNAIGMRRGGFDRIKRAEIKQVYNLFYREKLTLDQALEAARGQEWGDGAKVFIDFMSQKSKRGYCMRTRQAT